MSLVALQKVFLLLLCTFCYIYLPTVAWSVIVGLMPAEDYRFSPVLLEDSKLEYLTWPSSCCGPGLHPKRARNL